MVEPRELHVLALIPLGLIALYLLQDKEENPQQEASEPKENYFLRYNNDEIFKGLLATEGHLRNIEGKNIQKNELGCVIKHSAEIESHADEAISHALIVQDKGKSDSYRVLRDNIREFRYAAQFGNLNPSEGIEQIRRIRHAFEKQNPEYNIDKCKACSIEVNVTPK